MEEPTIHAGVVQRAQRPAVRVGKYRLGPELGRDLLELRCNGIERLVPRDTFELLGPAATLRCNAPQRVEHTIGRIYAIDVLRYLRAQKSAGYRMRRIPLDLHRTPILHRDEHTAGVRTIVR